MKGNLKNLIATIAIFFFALSLSAPIAVFAENPTTVSLGGAGNFTILAETGISAAGSASIVGDVGISPAASSYITGFALNLPTASAFSTSALVTGKVYAPDYAFPSSANLNAAVYNMLDAYNDVTRRTPDFAELSGGNIGGLTLVPGVYKWGTNVTIPTDVTLSGGANDIWIFWVEGNLNMSSAAHVILSGGAQVGNIFWAIGGQTTLGAGSVFSGNILDQTTIVLGDGAQLNGRAMAQAAVSLGSNAIVTPTSIAPAPATILPPVPPAPNPTSTTVSPPVPTSTPVSASTSVASPDNAALKLQLDELLATLHSLQAQAGQQSLPTPSSNLGQQVQSIKTDLKVGSVGSDVKALQEFLISSGKGPAAQALGKNGTTIYFGALTRAALAEFQESVGITPASGYFGAKTRSYLSTH